MGSDDCAWISRTSTRHAQRTHTHHPNQSTGRCNVMTRDTKLHGRPLGLQLDHNALSKWGSHFFILWMQQTLLQGHVLYFSQCRGNLSKDGQHTLQEHAPMKHEILCGWNVSQIYQGWVARTDLWEAFKCVCLHNICLNPCKYAFEMNSRKPMGFMVSECGIESN